MRAAEQQDDKRKWKYYKFKSPVNIFFAASPIRSNMVHLWLVLCGGRYWYFLWAGISKCVETIWVSLYIMELLNKIEIIKYTFGNNWVIIQCFPIQAPQSTWQCLAVDLSIYVKESCKCNLKSKFMKMGYFFKNKDGIS